MEFQYRISFSSSSQTNSTLPILFVARMMVIFLVWIRGMDNILPPFLPFVEYFNLLRSIPWLFNLLDWVYWTSLLMVFVGFRYRFFSLVLGVLVFFAILSSKPQFSNSFLYSGCIFVLIGLYKPGLDWIFRVQIALLYLGAGLNKLFDPDWLSGQYFDYFFSGPYHNQLYLTLANLIPGKGLAQFFSYATISVELGLGVWALVNRQKVLLVGMINFFHLSMLLLTDGELSYLFFFLMAVSSYLLLPWEAKKGTGILYDSDSRIFQFVNFLDFDRFFNWVPVSSGNSQTFIPDKKNNTYWILLESVLYNKILVGFIILIITFLCRYKNHLLAIF